jgi:glycosyltransferase involved in cell wall biosynthesis
MDSKLKVLMVTEGFYPDGFGGAHTYVYNLSKNMAERGHDVYVLTIKTGKSVLSHEIIDGIKVFRYGTALHGPLLFVLRPIASILNSRALFRVLQRKIGFDVVNFHHPLPAFGISRSPACRNARKVYTFHSSMSEDVKVQIRKRRYFPRILDGIAISLIRWIEIECLKHASVIVVLSMFSKGYLTGTYGQDEKMIELVPGGVDTARFSPYAEKGAKRAELSIPEDGVIFLTARRLVARMGLENLIRAFRHVVDKEKGAFLMILGDGFLRDKLLGIIEDEGLKDNVMLKGAVEAAKMPGYYQSCDIFVVPSEQDEWFGLVTIEALSCGIPVLGTPVGATPEILGKIDDGMLFTGTGVREMAKGMLKYLDKKEYYSGRSRELRKYAEDNYSWEAVSLKTESIYREK